MSLIGNLEDLSLPDILQIISLSKKSGVLVIHRGDEEGKIHIRQGKVMLTMSDRHRRNIGDILLDKGLIDRAQLTQAVAVQKREGMKDLLGMVLVNMGLLDRDALEQVVQEQIEESVFHFLTWREGTFRFDLKDVDPRLEVGIDTQVLMSQKGIDTQWLVLEGTRLLDERRRKGPIREQEDLAERPLEAVRKELGHIVLVDDDDLFCDSFLNEAKRLGFSTSRFAGVAEAREFLASSLGGEDLAMVVDVVMPTMDGRGFLGGLELARIVAQDHPEVRLRVITAYPDDSVQEELRKINAEPYLLKPDLSGSEGSQAAMETFMGRLLESFRKEPPGPRKPARREAAESPAAVEVPAAGPAPETDVETLIRVAQKALEDALNRSPEHEPEVSYLCHEVQQAGSQSEVGLMVLRLSSEILDRAILFKAVGDEVLSLGGFGFDPSIIKNRDGLRNLSVSMRHSPLLREVVARQAVVGSTDHAISDDDLMTLILGKPLPASWILVPARGAGDAVLLLYGDTGASGRPIAGTEVIASFFTLAGLFMIKLARERRITGAAAGDRTAAAP